MQALLLKLEECIENNYQGFELLSSHNESSKFEELKQIAPEIDSMPHNKFNEDKNSENSKEHNNNKVSNFVSYIFFKSFFIYKFKSKFELLFFNVSCVKK